jgi:hypothetical protein
MFGLRLRKYALTRKYALRSHQAVTGSRGNRDERSSKAALEPLPGFESYSKSW